MTKLNIYCLFDSRDALYGVYSSIKAVHRDALKICNTGTIGVHIRTDEELLKPSVTVLRNIFKGEVDVKVDYFSDKSKVTILKTNIKE
jgi:hypothetical protein|tara:strand:+ start:437 stop:700 length:264 start_codon:yes stop_codon:yes gene_type:complete